MTWIEKDRPSPFDQQPITGLFFLDGDRFAEQLDIDRTAGQKQAMIAFPSGEQFAVWESLDVAGSPLVQLPGNP